MTLGNMRAKSVRTLAAWCLGHGSLFTEQSADCSIILYWQHAGPNSRRKPQPMTADEAMTAAQTATLKELAMLSKDTLPQDPTQHLRRGARRCPRIGQDQSV
jgi:hypothetical protein